MSRTSEDAGNTAVNRAVTVPIPQGFPVWGKLNGTEGLELRELCPGPVPLTSQALSH